MIDAKWAVAASLAILLGLAACKPAPTIAEIDAAAKATLQQELDAGFAGRKLSVETITLVHGQRAHYVGTATIGAGTFAFTTPVQVTFDKTGTRVDLNQASLAARLKQDLAGRIAGLDGKYADFVLDPGLIALFPDALVGNKDALAQFGGRLQTVVPIVRSGEVYFGSGCATSDCGQFGNMAAWTIDANSGAAIAVVMITTQVAPAPNAPPAGPGPLPVSTSFEIYGAAADALPPPLAQWASINGMTAQNAVVVTGQ
jgi:hypothetical protein